MFVGCDGLPNRLVVVDGCELAPNIEVVLEVCGFEPKIEGVVCCWEVEGKELKGVVLKPD